VNIESGGAESYASGRIHGLDGLRGVLMTVTNALRVGLT
jgi:hypothetical protein